MNLGKSFKFAAIAIAVMALAQFAQAQSDVKISNMTVGTGSVRWDLLASDAGGSITISFPDGRSFTKDFKGSSIQFDLTDKQLDGAPDGVYNYELRTGSSAKVKRTKDDEPEGDRASRKRAAVAPSVQSGTFAIVNGALIGPGAVEGERTGANSAKPQTPASSARQMVTSGNTITRLRNHRFSLAPPMFDFVIADDLIVQGSACVGLD